MGGRAGARGTKVRVIDGRILTPWQGILAPGFLGGFLRRHPAIQLQDVSNTIDAESFLLSDGVPKGQEELAEFYQDLYQELHYRRRLCVAVTDANLGEEALSEAEKTCLDEWYPMLSGGERYAVWDHRYQIALWTLHFFPDLLAATGEKAQEFSLWIVDDLRDIFISRNIDALDTLSSHWRQERKHAFHYTTDFETVITFDQRFTKNVLEGLHRERHKDLHGRVLCEIREALNRIIDRRSKIDGGLVESPIGSEAFFSELIRKQLLRFSLTIVVVQVLERLGAEERKIVRRVFPTKTKVYGEVADELGIGEAESVRHALIRSKRRGVPSKWDFGRGIARNRDQ
mgnify:CR=1 FL=1